MAGQFMMHISSSFVIGIICAFPYAFWEFWKFISPGLYPNERKAAKGATFYVSLLFFIGVFFGYFVLTPISINFLANYQLDPSILNEFDIISYVGTITTLVLASGILFQLPMIILFLTKAGVVNKEILRSYRKHAIVVILVVLLFGRGKISSLMGDVAKGIKSFKKGMASDVTDDSETKNISDENQDSNKKE